ncbi:protein rolling stone-like [Dreissena polymorpha]|uniref:Uncharacterized protein n=1 Tax=Dreissena polymorpha TaxID=45954 RepID=A0A9D4GVP4_DREPO|nr:protein rolling stone-like [Dreissena polymorpha]XP_052283791.1 protein rolling stone-like [Dreissena polymorpha]XP_052283792.1 protein rolling stone-like [Dreissena polymorpha]KAH3820772.1 hypothetical protein DPMN_122521 [Dreissena polymorpha]
MTMSGSQCCGSVRRELQRKYFGFTEAHPARFCFWQWRVPPLAILLYRFCVAAYTMFWVIYTSRNTPDTKIQEHSISIMAFLTTWTYIVLTVYLVLHFIITCVHFLKSELGLLRRLTSENHRRLFHELQVQPSLWGNQEYEYVPGTADGTDVELVITYSPNLLSKIVWILYNIASSASIMVTILFWALLFPYLPKEGDKYLLFNIQLHAVTSVIVILEHSLSAIPIRLQHAIFTLIYGLCYLTFAGIMYAVHHSNIFYPGVLDFSQPSRTAVMCVVVVFVVLPLIQLFLFGIYKFRMWLFDTCNPEEL